MGRPWPDVAELAAAVPAHAWALIGGLMVQLHGVAAGLPVVRPPNDVDVLLHVETGRGRAAQVAGGTQALRRTVRAELEITGSTRTTINVPDAFGALILKAAAPKADTRDRDRHLTDAAVLLACVDPFEQRTRSGSDRSRLLHLREQLADPTDPTWLLLPPDARRNGQAALDLLCA